MPLTREQVYVVLGAFNEGGATSERLAKKLTKHLGTGAVYSEAEVDAFMSVASTETPAWVKKSGDNWVLLGATVLSPVILPQSSVPPSAESGAGKNTERDQENLRELIDINNHADFPEEFRETTEFLGKLAPNSVFGKLCTARGILICAKLANKSAEALRLLITELEKRPNAEEVELLLSKRAEVSPDDWGAVKAKIEALENEARDLRLRPNISVDELNELRAKTLQGEEKSVNWVSKLLDSMVVQVLLTFAAVFLACFLAMGVFFMIHPLQPSTMNTVAPIQKPAVGDKPTKEEDPYDIEMRAMKAGGRDTPQARKD